MKPTNQSLPLERSSSALSQIVFQLQNNPGIGPPGPASASADAAPGHSNLSYGQLNHPNLPQQWKRRSPVPSEHGKYSESSIKGFEDNQHLSRLLFPPICFGQGTNQQVPVFGSDQYPSSNCHTGPEFRHDSSLTNLESFRPTQHATQSGQFSDVPHFPHDHCESNLGIQTHKNQPRRDPIPGTSDGDYRDAKDIYPSETDPFQIDNMDFSGSGVAHPSSSHQAEYPPGKKKPWKRRITEKRREQNRAHQKAFRLRRDLLLKHKDAEINAMKDYLERLQVSHTEQHEVITHLQKKLRSVEYLRSGRNSSNSLATTAGHYSFGDGLCYDESLPWVETVHGNESRANIPSGKVTRSEKGPFRLGKIPSNRVVETDLSSPEWASKFSEGELSNMNYRSEDSSFPCVPCSSTYVPNQSMYPPNMPEESSKEYRQSYRNSQ